MGYLHEAEDELVLHGYSEKNKRINYSYIKPIWRIISNISFMK